MYVSLPWNTWRPPISRFFDSFCRGSSHRSELDRDFRDLQDRRGPILVVASKFFVRREACRHVVLTAFVLEFRQFDDHVRQENLGRSWRNKREREREMLYRVYPLSFKFSAAACLRHIAMRSESSPLGRGSN